MILRILTFLAVIIFSVVMAEDIKKLKVISVGIESHHLTLLQHNVFLKIFIINEMNRV